MAEEGLDVRQTSMAPLGFPIIDHKQTTQPSKESVFSCENEEHPQMVMVGDAIPGIGVSPHGTPWWNPISQRRKVRPALRLSCQQIWE